MPCEQNEQLGDGPLQCEALVGVSLRGRCISIQWRNSLLPLLEHFGVNNSILKKRHRLSFGATMSALTTS